MLTDVADALVWVIRLLLLAGLCWGMWLCFAHAFLPERSERTLEFEHFATFALLLLLFTTLGGVLHAG
jgi:hypothetical protein